MKIGRTRRSAASLVVAFALSTVILPRLTGSAAASVFADDFESGGLGSWTQTSGFTVQQQLVFGGAWAGRITTSGKPGYASKTLSSPQTDVFLDVRVNLRSSTGTVRLLRLLKVGGGGIASLRVASNGTLSIRNDVAGTTTTSAMTLSKGDWHEVQIHARAAGAASMTEVWLDGVRIADLSSTTSLGTKPVGRAHLGSDSAVTMDAAYDDVVVAASFVTADVTPPSVPQGLAAASVAGNRVDLVWSAATDDSGVAEYGIYRDGALIGSVPGILTTFSDMSVSPLTAYSYTVDAVDLPGRRSAPSSPLAVTTPALDPPPPSGGANVLVAAGDICQVAPTNCAGTASLVEASAPDVAVTLGDNQYSFGTLAQYLASYELEWGRFKEATKPSPGNHEWKTPGAQGYKDYFGASFLTNGGTWYSFDLGAWHVVSLDSQCLSIGGCGPGSPAHAWLQQDLANDEHACTLAYWHKPRFSSGTNHGSDTSSQPYWDLLGLEGAEIVLNGHEHNYERFAPQTPLGTSSETGIRQFVVGTGGNCCYPFGAPIANSEARITGTRGILELTLATTSYSWRFIAVGGAVLDSGTGVCH
jgi:chitodextrinase